MAKDTASLDKVNRAIKHDDVASVKLLLEGKIDPDARVGNLEWSFLHEAATKGALRSSEALIAAGALIDAKATNGETPLHLAAQKGHTAEVQLLAEKGADLGATNEDGETALHAALQQLGSKDLGHISALLEAKADPLAKDGQGADAGLAASIHTNRAKEIHSLLEKHGGGGGAEPEDAGQKLELLKLACKNGKTEAAQQVLGWLGGEAAAGAQAVLVQAAEGGHIEVLEALVAAKADPSVHDKEGSTTPLTAAAGENVGKALCWLLSHRANPQNVAKDGATPLMAASLAGSSDLIEVLLRSGADLNHANAESGWTSLMVASQQGHMTVVRKLLDAQANPLLKNSEGSAARELAKAGGQPDIMKAIEMRVKLDERREKVSATKPTGQGAQDTRDIDALLADLEGPSAGGGGAGKKASKAKSKAKKGGDGAEGKEGGAGDGDGGAAAAAVSAKESAAADMKALRAAAAAAKQRAARVKELQTELADLKKQRKDMDKREAKINKELAELDAAP